MQYAPGHPLLLLLHLIERLCCCVDSGIHTHKQGDVCPSLEFPSSSFSPFSRMADMVKNEHVLSFTKVSFLKRILFLYKPRKADIFVGAGGGGGDLSLTYMINIEEVEKIFGMW